jgi:hypothetical protein
LATQAFFKENVDGIINKLRALMTLLRQPKRKLILEHIHAPMPLLPNETRWSGNLDMINRYKELKPYLSQKFRRDDAVATNMLTPVQEAQLEDFANLFEVFSVATKKLQNSHVNLLQARKIFDVVLDAVSESNYADEPFRKYLDRWSRIAHSSVLEDVVVHAIENNNEVKPRDASMLQSFLLPEDDTDSESDTSNDYAEAVDHVAKINQVFDDVPKTDKKGRRYIDFKSIPATSNIVERLFSCAKHVYNDLRQGLEYESFESTMFLLVNKELWSYKLKRQVSGKQSQLSHNIVTIE